MTSNKTLSDPGTPARRSGAARAGRQPGGVAGQTSAGRWPATGQRSSAGCPETARLLAEFLNYIQVEKRLSRNTAVAYEQDLRRYAAFLARRGREANQARRTDVQEYLGVLYRARLDRDRKSVV